MCLAIPAHIIEINGTVARVDMAGNTTTADLAVLPEAKVGDYVMVHAGIAIERYEEEDALETLKLLAELTEKMGPL